MKHVRWILPAVLLALIGAGAAGCKSAYRSTDELTIHGRDIVYLKDERTSLCFAVLAVQNPLGTKIRQISMVSVPCEALSNVDAR